MLEVSDLCKGFQDETRLGRVKAVDHVSFAVKEGNFFTMLGPSGCGKTTTLRCIAGLERPDSGDISVDDRVLYSGAKGTFVSANQRNLGMVFQSYAIWPHMNVFENVAFPLKIGHRASAREIKERVEKALHLVHLEELGQRAATSLSGGQQQRLALARAVVREPKLLLLDEPLSNLDAKLRDEMRVELKRVQRTLGLTTIYVTHDQTEALSMSDTVAVMNKGKVVQLAAPREIYEKPVNSFVADFIGSANMLRGKVVALGGAGENLVQTQHGPLSCAAPQTADIHVGSDVLVSVRPEDIQLTAATAPNSSDWFGIVDQVAFLGGLIEYQIKIADTRLRARVHPANFFQEGEAVNLTCQPERCCIVSRED
jgi:iron(III) transport system ATP-binding protein